MGHKPEPHAGHLSLAGVLSVVVTAVLMAIGWVWFVGSLRPHELIVGAVVVALSTAFCTLVFRAESLPFELRAHDILQGWRIPGAMVSKCAQITGVLLRDLAGQPAGSFYRVCGFRSGLRDPAAIARSALAIAYSTAAPNFIVIGIDPHQNHMLFHQIERTEVSSMTKALGAQR